MMVCRTTGGDEDLVTVQISDETSGCLIVEARFSLAEYATAVLSGFGAGTMRVPKKAPIGFEIEAKTEVVDIPKQAKDGRIRKIIAAHEVDGWAGSDADAKNRHRNAGQTKAGWNYRVGYRRYVHPETGEVWKK